jgi:large subunit ribosomal protein L30
MTTQHKGMRSMLRVTQVHSLIGNQERVKRVLTDGLGLRRIGASVLRPDNAYTRGMIAKLSHMVRFEEVMVEGEAAKKPARRAVEVAAVAPAPVAAPTTHETKVPERHEEPATAPAMPRRAAAPTTHEPKVPERHEEPAIAPATPKRTAAASKEKAPAHKVAKKAPAKAVRAPKVAKPAAKAKAAPKGGAKKRPASKKKEE